VQTSKTPPSNGSEAGPAAASDAPGAVVPCRLLDATSINFTGSLVLKTPLIAQPPHFAGERFAGLLGEGGTEPLGSLGHQVHCRAVDNLLASLKHPEDHIR